MEGRTLNIKIYVTGENLEKLERIREHLNGKNDVQSGDVDRWKKSDVMNYYSTMQLIISNFRQAFPCLFPVRWRCVSGSISGGTVPQAFILRFRAFRPSSGQEHGASR